MRRYSVWWWPGFCEQLLPFHPFQGCACLVYACTINQIVLASNRLIYLTRPRVTSNCSNLILQLRPQLATALTALSMGNTVKIAYETTTSVIEHLYVENVQ
jgi:hypothetical protein